MKHVSMLKVPNVSKANKVDSRWWHPYVEKPIEEGYSERGELRDALHYREPLAPSLLKYIRGVHRKSMQDDPAVFDADLALPPYEGVPQHPLNWGTAYTDEPRLRPPGMPAMMPLPSASSQAASSSSKGPQPTP